jgi:hypothetical protein
LKVVRLSEAGTDTWTVAHFDTLEAEFFQTDAEGIHLRSRVVFRATERPWLIIRLNIVVSGLTFRHGERKEKEKRKRKKYSHKQYTWIECQGEKSWEKKKKKKN